MKILKVKKGKNLFKANCFDIIPKVYLTTDYLYTGSVIFTEDSKYQLDSKDQKDTNKGYGISNSLISNFTSTTIMLGWRYNPSTDLFELYPYCHDSSKKPIWPVDENGVLKVMKTCSVGEKVEYLILVNPESNVVKFRFVDQDDIFEYEFKDRISGPIRVTDYWFGGDDSNDDGIGGKAPKDLKLKAEFKRIK